MSIQSSSPEAAASCHCCQTAAACCCVKLPRPHPASRHPLRLVGMASAACSAAVAAGLLLLLLLSLLRSLARFAASTIASTDSKGFGPAARITAAKPRVRAQSGDSLHGPPTRPWIHTHDHKQHGLAARLMAWQERAADSAPLRACAGRSESTTAAGACAARGTALHACQLAEHAGTSDSPKPDVMGTLTSELDLTMRRLMPSLAATGCTTARSSASDALTSGASQKSPICRCAGTAFLTACR